MSVVSLSLTDIYKPDYDYEHHGPGYKFEIENKEQITELNVNGCIARFIQQQKRRNHRDEKLWDAYVDQFGNWTKELFETAAKIAISDLRDFLRENGVFVYKKQRVSIAGELAKTASEEAQHKWTDDEIAEVINKDEPFNSRYHPEYRSVRTLSFHSGTCLPKASPSAQLLASMMPNMSQIQTTEPIRNLLFAPRVQKSKSNLTEYLLSGSQNSSSTNQQYQQLHQQLEEKHNVEDYYQNLDTYKQKEPIAPYKYPDIAQHTSSNSSNIPPQPFHNPPLQQFHNPPPHPSNNLPTQQQNIPLNFNHQRRNNNTNKSNSQNQYFKNNTQVQSPQTYHQASGHVYTGREITNLRRSYSEEMKFKGADDCLNLKLHMFYDLCSESGVSQQYYRAAFPIMLTSEALTYYYSALAGRNLDFDTTIQKMRSQYETEQQQQKDFTKWSTITLANVIANNVDKSIEECLNLMTERLRKLQSRLNSIYQTPKALRDRLINACRSIPECSFACYNPAPTLEGFCAQLQSSIATALEIARTSPAHRSINQSNQYIGDQNYEQFFTNRRYHVGKGFHRPAQQSRSQVRSTKKCFVCKRLDCWSTKHSQREKEHSLNEFRKRIQRNGRKIDENLIRQYIVDYEGQDTNDTIDSDEEEFEALMVQLKLEENDNIPETSQYMTAYGEIDGFNAISQLHDQSVHHALTAAAPIKDKTNRYNSLTFQGIMIDTGAAQWSTAGEAQVRALQKLRNIKIDSSTAGQVRIIFGIGTTTSLGTLSLETNIGIINFHVVPSNTPFLLSLKDMDTLKVKFDNLRNVLLQGNQEFPVVRKFGHPFLLLTDITTAIIYSCDAECHLSEPELRQLHRRFGHPSSRRLLQILKRSGHNVDSNIVKHLSKYCHLCQLHGKSPGRFKFTLRDDIEFNHSIVVDVMYIEGNPVLHVIDEATRFGAARWLKNISTQHTWDMLRNCWIDVYIGPPDHITHDAGSNFASREFRQHAEAMNIKTNQVPVDAHQSVGIVERYHAPLRRASIIIASELKGRVIDKEMMLQMAVKAVNDTAGPRGLVPTLLVFGAYPRMSEVNPPAPSIFERANAIKAAMKEVRKCYSTRQVQEALRMRNGPNTDKLHRLQINDEVLVWREKDGWTGPFKMFSLSGTTCMVDLPNGPTAFRTTVVKPFYTDGSIENNNVDPTSSLVHTFPVPDSGSTSETTEAINTRPQRLKRQLPARYREDTSFLSQKEVLDLEISKKLRQEGVITTHGKPFEISQQNEIDSLVTNGVFEFVPYDAETMNDSRLFNSRMVNEVKGKATATPYEKSRLVIQAYNDNGKRELLTQSPTIQRMSQRLIVSIAPSLFGRANLYLRDITQAYVQSKTTLNRTVLARPPKEMMPYLPENTIMKVKKPLYGISEAGTHWYSPITNTIVIDFQ